MKILIVIPHPDLEEPISLEIEATIEEKDSKAEIEQSLDTCEESQKNIPEFTTTFLDNRNSVNLVVRQEPLPQGPEKIIRKKPEKARVSEFKTCLNCGETFKPSGNRQLYCTERCKKEYQHNKDWEDVRG